MLTNYTIGDTIVMMQLEHHMTAWPGLGNLAGFAARVGAGRLGAEAGWAAGGGGAWARGWGGGCAGLVRGRRALTLLLLKHDCLKSASAQYLQVE